MTARQRKLEAFVRQVAYSTDPRRAGAATPPLRQLHVEATKLIRSAT